MLGEFMHGDCRELMAVADENTIDAVVTDPPYGLEFMSSAWDQSVPGIDYWTPLLRVMKPGAHLLTFGGTRTFHRMAVAIEDSGFEIRDCLSWLYGSGFPKSLDVSKAIDKAAGAERKSVGSYQRPDGSSGRTASQGFQAVNTYGVGVIDGEPVLTAPATPQAEQWQGYGTALKPAWEPIILARKPFKGTVANNVLTHGTGALNIDGCRIEADDLEDLQKNWDRTQSQAAYEGRNAMNGGLGMIDLSDRAPSGRWPANALLDEDAAALLDEQTGGASRFFYCAKASRSERTAGCETNNHPTLKPLNLMRYLVRLIAHPGALILDPFSGSGSTIIAANLEGFDAVGMDLSAEHCAVAQKRLAYWREHGTN